MTTARERCKHDRWRDMCAVCKDRSAELAAKARPARTGVKRVPSTEPLGPVNRNVAYLQGGQGSLRKRYHVALPEGGSSCGTRWKNGVDHSPTWTPVTLAEVEAEQDRRCRNCCPQAR